MSSLRCVFGRSARTIGSRSFSSHTVPLAFEKYSEAANPNGNPPLVVCHGLFGSKQNWRSLGKAMSLGFKRTVYCLDLRNHGDSPHSPIHTYEAMADDLFAFLKEQQLENPVLLGHSMGGKAVMTAALRDPKLVSKLIVVDMPPVPLPLARDFLKYGEAMKKIEEQNPPRIKDADAILAEYESGASVRQFLLTNMRRLNDGTVKFRVPYGTLCDSLGHIAGFEFPAGAMYDRPTLFVVGGNSPYRAPFLASADPIRTLFPNATLETIQGAGHWVHAEKPKAFMQLLEPFVAS